MKKNYIYFIINVYIWINIIKNVKDAIDLYLVILIIVINVNFTNVMIAIKKYLENLNFVKNVYQRRNKIVGYVI